MLACLDNVLEQCVYKTTLNKACATAKSPKVCSSTLYFNYNRYGNTHSRAGGVPRESTVVYHNHPLVYQRGALVEVSPVLDLFLQILTEDTQHLPHLCVVGADPNFEVLELEWGMSRVDSKVSTNSPTGHPVRDGCGLFPQKHLRIMSSIIVNRPTTNTLGARGKVEI